MMPIKLQVAPGVILEKQFKEDLEQKLSKYTFSLILSTSRKVEWELDFKGSDKYEIIETLSLKKDLNKQN